MVPVSLFIAEQDGRILVVPKGSDGAEATEFLNITDRKPHADNNNVGLLGMALHPGFKTNGLCYVLPQPVEHKRRVPPPPVRDQ